MSNWLRGEWTTVTQEQTKIAWGGGKNGRYFRCMFCGHKFKANDEFRAIFTNCKSLDERGIPGGNPLTCRTCNPSGELEEMYEKWKQLHAEWDAVVDSPRFWWLKNQLTIQAEQGQFS